MPFKFLPDVAIADIAFEAESGSLGGLFESCALALTEVMVDPATLGTGVSRKFSLSADDTDRLLYDFMTELIVLKDVDSLLFKDFKVSIAAGGGTLTAEGRGETIDREKHTLRNDVKAVTMHMFGVVRKGDFWKATVVLDI